MQNKITLAIDALASAAFVEGGVSPENTQAARDLTEQRKRELVEAIAAPQSLLQIQEPEADIWPCVNIDVDERGNVTNAKLYSPGLPAGNHDVYPVRVPYIDEHSEAWLACAAELEKASPGFMTLGNMNGIECAVAAIRDLAARAASAQAAPAAVAVPKCPFPCDWENLHKLAVAEGAFLAGSLHVDKPITEHQRNTVMRVVNYSIEMARAALSATPEASNSHESDGIKNAAPVGLPEPDAWRYTDANGNFRYRGKRAGFASEYPLLKPEQLYTEKQVRALLATATGLPAQAPMQCVECNSCGAAYDIDGYQAGFTDGKGHCPECPGVDHAAPQAQAVERGEVLVTVSGFTGSGKSAIAGEIEIMCRALGLQVEWPDSDSEKHMTHADWIAALEQYKPRVRIVECNVPHSVVKGQDK